MGADWIIETSPSITLSSRGGISPALCMIMQSRLSSLLSRPAAKVRRLACPSCATFYPYLSARPSPSLPAMSYQLDILGLGLVHYCSPGRESTNSPELSPFPPVSYRCLSLSSGLAPSSLPLHSHQLEHLRSPLQLSTFAYLFETVWWHLSRW